MKNDLTALDLQATAMFDAMQRVLEDRDTPIVQSYQDDFYKHDRNAVAQSFAPGAEYLWLLHTNGTHFGMIGVLPVKETFMHAVVKGCPSMYRPESMELHHIKVHPNGETMINKVDTHDQSALLESWRPKVVMRGNTLHKTTASYSDLDKSRLAEISVKMTPINTANRAYISKIETGERVLTRFEAMAAAMHAESSAVQLSDLFVKCEERLINGIDFEQAFPSAQIPEAEPGKYAPVITERERG